VDKEPLKQRSEIGLRDVVYLTRPDVFPLVSGSTVMPPGRTSQPTRNCRTSDSVAVRGSPISRTANFPNQVEKDRKTQRSRGSDQLGNDLGKNQTHFNNNSLPCHFREGHFTKGRLRGQRHLGVPMPIKLGQVPTLVCSGRKYNNHATHRRHTTSQSRTKA